MLQISIEAFITAIFRIQGLCVCALVRVYKFALLILLPSLIVKIHLHRTSSSWTGVNGCEYAIHILAHREAVLTYKNHLSAFAIPILLWFPYIQIYLSVALGCTN